MTPKEALQWKLDRALNQVDELRTLFDEADRSLIQTQKRLTQLEAELAEARKDGEQYRQNWLALQEATGEDCQQRALEVIREARKDLDRMDKLEEYPYAMEIKAITKYHKSDSVPSLRAQIDHFIATELDAARGAK